MGVGLKPKFAQMKYLILIERHTKKDLEQINKMVRIFINNLPKNSKFEVIEYSKNFVRFFRNFVDVDPKSKNLAKNWVLDKKNDLILDRQTSSGLIESLLSVNL